MFLGEILKRQDVPEVEISGITNDSRDVKPGDLFIAYRGGQFDAHEFVQDAVQAGAAAICAEIDQPPDISIPWVKETDIAQRQAEFAARFHAFPSRHLNVIGVTGTNGKTSVAFGIANLLDSTAFMGTLGWGLPNALAETALTTMGSVALQRGLSQLIESEFQQVAMEVSSHALAQGRVNCVEFDGAVFTNLTRDHLDYHKSMRNYADTKMKLFEHSDLRYGIVNQDDEFGRLIVDRLRERNIKCLTYGTSSSADLSWSSVRHTSKGLCGRWLSPWGNDEFFLPFYGSMYVANAAAILLTSLCNGQQFAEVVAQMHSLPTVPGRMEFIKRDGRPTVVIDYAHTSDALRHALVAVRAHAQGRVFCVFGCGGARDVGKRPEMGRIAEIVADQVYLTSDNPRDESPDAIAHDILQGMAEPDAVVVELDRESAIQLAIEAASPGDVVLVAGKGRERFQEIQGERLPIDDYVTVENILSGAHYAVMAD